MQMHEVSRRTFEGGDSKRRGRFLSAVFSLSRKALANAAVDSVDCGRKNLRSRQKEGQAVETTGDRKKLQLQIAAIAARMIVEEGRDSAQAKRKAAAALAGHRARAPSVLPDKEQMDAALREYLRTVVGAPHQALLRRLRTAAAQWMQRLEGFRPHLVGAVLDGSATQHSPLKLNLYAESVKDVEMALLQQRVAFRVAEPPRGDSHALEVIGFLAPAGGNPRNGNEESIAVLLTVYEAQALRVAPDARSRSSDPLLHPIERCGRASLPMLRQLLQESDATDSEPPSRD